MAFSDIPKPRQVCVHHSGRRYVLERIVNLATLTDQDLTRAVTFPVSAVYFKEGEETNPFEWYSRSLEDFRASFSPG